MDPSPSPLRSRQGFKRSEIIGFKIYRSGEEGRFDNEPLIIYSVVLYCILPSFYTFLYNFLPQPFSFPNHQRYSLFDTLKVINKIFFTFVCNIFLFLSVKNLIFL